MSVMNSLENYVGVAAFILFNVTFTFIALRGFLTHILSPLSE